MKAIRRFVTRLAGVAGFRRTKQDCRMEQEFREHIELQTADYIRAGIPAEEARCKAILKFGPVEALKEEFRDQRSMPVLERFMKDLRHALRTLAHEPGFSILTTLMLAIGLAGAITVFSLVNGILLKPLPYRDPGRLVAIREIIVGLERSFPSVPVNAYRFIEWRKHCRSFESMAILERTTANVTGPGDPERFDAAAVSPNFFRILGVDAARGRAFRDDEEQTGKSQVVVLTDGLWRRKFNADRAAIGMTISLNGRVHTVIGVLPPGFRFPDYSLIFNDTGQPELFFPKVFDRWDRTIISGRGNYGAIARLKPGVSRRQAAYELEIIQARVEKQDGGDRELHALVTPLIDAISGKARLGLMILMAAIGLVVLLVCVNLGNLLLARAENHSHELGLRAALGASRVRLATHTLAEAGLIALVGGALGLGIATAIIGVLKRQEGLNIPRLAEVAVDSRVVLFALAGIAATTAAFGFLPAWRASKGYPKIASQSGARRVSDPLSSKRIRSMLVAGEVGICIPLLVLAGLLADSFVRLINADKGFTGSTALAVEVKLAGDKYISAAARVRFFQNILSNAGSSPGVAAAAVSSHLPLQGETWIEYVSTIKDASIEDLMKKPVNLRFVSADYFRTLGIPISAGRTFGDSDGSSACVVSARLAASLWPGRDPVGRRFFMGNGEPFTVIGVVGDVRADPEKPPAPIMYRPYWEEAPNSMTLVARAEGAPQSIRGAVRSAIRRADPDAPIPRMRTMAGVLDERVVARRFETTLAGAFALIALVVASLGIYAVVSYTVARRTAEIGVRTALGARAGHIYRIVLVEGLAPVAIGLLVGIPCALAGARHLNSMLYGVRPNDAAAISAAVLILAMVAVAACLIPARRAARINPVVSLKYE